MKTAHNNIAVDSAASAEQATRTFWRSDLGCAPTFDITKSNVHVLLYGCGCKVIHEHSDLATRKEYELQEKCRRHRHRVPKPSEQLLAVEYYA